MLINLRHSAHRQRRLLPMVCAAQCLLLANMLIAGAFAASPAREDAEQQQDASAAPDAGPTSVASQTQDDMPEVVLARVGASQLTAREFVRAVSMAPSATHAGKTDKGRAELFEGLVSHLLIREVAVKQGLLESREGVTKAAFASAKRQLAEEHFPLPPVPKDEVLERYFEDNAEAFGIPAAVRVRQLQFRAPAQASETELAATRERADRAMERLAAGESFAQLAEELSENPSAKSRGGDLGFVTRYGNPWLDAALDGTRPGETTGVVKSPVGFEILKMIDKRDAILPAFEDVKEEVTQRWRDEQQAIARERYLRQLESEIGIDIVADDFKRLFPNGVFAR
jgi:hypothetical protein